MTEPDFREQMIANVATLTEAVDTLKDSVKEMAGELREDDNKGRLCRAEVDKIISDMRIDLEAKINDVKNRSAYISGALGLVGVLVGVLLKTAM
ncbi:MAG: hypothetical protein WC322_06145 [Candidatus Paceibacterota bacterium]|jgi:hypothetical protein